MDEIKKLENEIEHQRKIMGLSIIAAEDKHSGESLRDLFNRQARRCEDEVELLLKRLAALKPNKNKKLSKKRKKK